MQYIPVAPPTPQTTANFRDFKKSTAMCKVHNVGLRYINTQREIFSPRLTVGICRPSDSTVREDAGLLLLWHCQSDAITIQIDLKRKYTPSNIQKISKKIKIRLESVYLFIFLLLVILNYKLKIYRESVTK